MGVELLQLPSLRGWCRLSIPRCAMMQCFALHPSCPRTRRTHPTLALSFTCRHARSLSIYREGLEAFHKAYHFLVRMWWRVAPAEACGEQGCKKSRVGQIGWLAVLHAVRGQRLLFMFNIEPWDRHTQLLLCSAALQVTTSVKAGAATSRR